ncbi:hypothetical protein GCM10025857_09030 [Alicyclobacillus contaminans]|uniref:hypothetical protein n=1 Tax=Alicyclobacillus contaminans TaxID=392016 RepID=UPI0003FAF0A9|nr:hypothetical protein [Alicyclobacillus contaminans]GMA49546.1 hypothetical protein GCM10025857_09030 [Alicyclobacillus contaminans]
MQKYDPLDWIHQWDNYEMMMYARTEQEGDPGIFMQVSRKVMVDGAEQWEIVYDRRLDDLLEVAGEPGSDEWQERLLRTYLNEHPSLVADEKRYLQQYEAGEIKD